RQCGGGGRAEEGRVVVLAQGEHIQTDLLCVPRDGHHRADPLMLGGGPTRGWVGGDVADREDAELHAMTSGLPVRALGLTMPSTGPTRMVPDNSCVVNDYRGAAEYRYHAGDVPPA